MVDKAPTDQRTTDMEKSQVHIGAPLVPDAQAAVAVQPRERALDYPPMPAQPIARLNAWARDAWRNASPAQLLAQGLRVVGLVGVQLRGALARSAHGALNRLDGVHRGEHHPRVVDIGRAHHDGERDTLPVHDHMAFRA